MPLREIRPAWPDHRGASKGSFRGDDATELFPIPDPVHQRRVYASRRPAGMGQTDCNGLAADAYGGTAAFRCYGTILVPVSLDTHPSLGDDARSQLASGRDGIPTARKPVKKVPSFYLPSRTVWYTGR